MPPTTKPFISRLALTVVVTFVTGLALFAVARLGPVASRDAELTGELHELGLDHPTVETAARAITWIGHPVTLAILVIVTAGALLAMSRRHIAAWLVVVSAAGAITETALKLTIRRSRPDLGTALLQARGTSFPSGHAMNTTIVLGALVLTALATLHHTRHTTVAAGLLAVLVIGVVASRTVLGVHYLSDVTAGCLLGVAWLALLAPTIRPVGYSTVPPLRQ